MKTANGGANWVSQTSGTTELLMSGHFPVDALTGYAVGGAGAIRKTTDGGGTWVAQAAGTSNWLYAVPFPADASTGYITVEGGFILKTTNGGANWVSQTSGTTESLLSGHFPVDASTGYAVGSYGTIQKTMDGGSGVEETAGIRDQGLGIRLTANPNPFTSFATLPGHEAERFNLYDVSGRKVGTYRGDRVGEGLAPGVYFLRSSDSNDKPLRIVKVR